MPQDKILILPLTKGPQNRIGPMPLQDWYRGLLKAKKLLSMHRPGAAIFIISNVHVAGYLHEADVYSIALSNLNVDSSDIRVLREAQETVGQLHIADKIAKQENRELTIISTWLHYFRVRWICRRDSIQAKHCIVFGIPRPGEAASDIIMWGLFPLIDLLGKRAWFLRKVEVRRLSGKH